LHFYGVTAVSICIPSRNRPSPRCYAGIVGGPATGSTLVPVVFALVAGGFVASVACPGGNVTGFIRIEPPRAARRTVTCSTRFSEMESEKACDYNDHYDYADDVENIHRSAPIDECTIVLDQCWCIWMNVTSVEFERLSLFPVED
jgi:hypothetical protein